MSRDLHRRSAETAQDFPCIPRPRNIRRRSRPPWQRCGRQVEAGRACVRTSPRVGRCANLAGLHVGRGDESLDLAAGAQPLSSKCRRRSSQRIVLQRVALPRRERPHGIRVGHSAPGECRGSGCRAGGRAGCAGWGLRSTSCRARSRKARKAPRARRPPTVRPWASRMAAFMAPALVPLMPSIPSAARPRAARPERPR